MSEIQFRASLDDSQFQQALSKIQQSFKKMDPGDPLKGLDKKVEKLADAAKELGFEWEGATKKFKNDSGFTQTTAEMAATLKSVSAQAKASGTNFKALAGQIKTSGESWKYITNGAQQYATKSSAAAAKTRQLMQNIDALGNEATQSAQALNRLGQGGATGLQGIGTTANSTKNAIDALGNEAAQTGQTLASFGTGAAGSGIKQLSVYAKQTDVSFDGLNMSVAATAKKIGTINGQGLQNVYLNANKAGSSLDKTGKSAGTLERAIKGVNGGAVGMTALSRSLNTAAAGGRQAGISVGQLSNAVRRAGQTAPALSAIPVQFTRGAAAAKAAATAAKGAGQQFGMAGQKAKSMQSLVAQGFQQMLLGIPQGIGMQLANGLIAPLRALTGVMPKAVAAFSNLDEKVRQVLSITGNAADEFARVSDMIGKVATSSAATAEEVGEIAISLSRAGLSLEEIEAALGPITQGAEATGTGYQEMADIVASALGQFKLEATEAADVVDTLTVAANGANQTVGDLGNALKYVGPVANSVNQSLQDTAVQLQVLANSGIRASQAGTSLRTILTNLSIGAQGAGEDFDKLTRGSSRLVKALQMIGADMTDANGELKTGTALIFGLQDAMKSLSAGEQARISKVLAGNEGLPAMNALISASKEEVIELAKAMDGRLGAAATAQQSNLAGLSGSFKLFQSAASAAFAALGEAVAGPMKALVDGVTEVVKVITGIVKAFNSMPGPIKAMISSFVAFKVAMLAGTLAAKAFTAAMKTAFGVQIVNAIKAVTAALNANTLAQNLNTLATGAGKLAGVLQKGFKNALDGARLGLTKFGNVVAKVNQGGLKTLTSQGAGAGGMLKKLSTSFSVARGKALGTTAQLNLFSGAAGQAAAKGAAIGTATKGAGVAMGGLGVKAGAAAAGMKGATVASGALAGGLTTGAIAATGIGAALVAVGVAVAAGVTQNQAYNKSMKEWTATNNKLKNAVKETGEFISASAEDTRTYTQRMIEGRGPLAMFGKALGPLGLQATLVADGFARMGDAWNASKAWLEENGRINALRDSFNQLKGAMGQADGKIREIQQSQIGLNTTSQAWIEKQKEIINLQNASVMALTERRDKIKEELDLVNRAGEGNSRYAERLREQLGEVETLLKVQQQRETKMRQELKTLGKVAAGNLDTVNSFKALTQARTAEQAAIKTAQKDAEVAISAQLASGLIDESTARLKNAAVAKQAADKLLDSNRRVVESAKARLAEGKITETEYEQIVQQASKDIVANLEKQAEAQKGLTDATSAAVDQRLGEYKAEVDAVGTAVQGIGSLMSQLSGIGTSAVSQFKSLGDAITNYELTGINRVKDARMKMIDSTYKDGVAKERAKRKVEKDHENARRKIMQRQIRMEEAALEATFAMKRAELEIEHQMAMIANQIAQIEADIAIQKAIARGASEQELQALQNIKTLREAEGNILSATIGIRREGLRAEELAAKYQIKTKARAEGVATAYSHVNVSQQAVIASMNSITQRTTALQGYVQGVGENFGTVDNRVQQVAASVREDLNAALNGVSTQQLQASLEALGFPPETAAKMANTISGAVEEGGNAAKIKLSELFSSGDIIPTRLLQEELVNGFAQAYDTSVEDAKEIFSKLPAQISKEDLAKTISEAMGIGVDEGTKILDQIELGPDAVASIKSNVKTGVGEGGKEGAEDLKGAVEGAANELETKTKDALTRAFTGSEGAVQKLGEVVESEMDGAFQAAGKTLVNSVQQEIKETAGTVSESVEDAFANLNLSSVGQQVVDKIKTPIDEAALALEGITPPENFGTVFSEVRDSAEGVADSGIAREMKESAQSAQATKRATDQLPNRISRAASSARQFATAMERAAAAAEKAARANAGRAAGGPVAAGQTYTVNEYGREMFMSGTGRLSEINAPRWGKWTAPSTGTVIPANISQQIRDNRRSSQITKALTASPGSATTQVKVQEASANSDNLQRALIRELQGLQQGPGGAVSNNITIQSQKPVNDASRMLAEMNRLRAYRR